ncbi:hypothetical protein NONI108955_44815 [Nocardia ninae]
MGESVFDYVVLEVAEVGVGVVGGPDEAVDEVEGDVYGCGTVVLAVGDDHIRHEGAQSSGVEVDRVDVSIDVVHQLRQRLQLVRRGVADFAECGIAGVDFGQSGDGRGYFVDEDGADSDGVDDDVLLAVSEEHPLTFAARVPHAVMQDGVARDHVHREPPREQCVRALGCGFERFDTVAL